MTAIVEQSAPERGTRVDTPLRRFLADFFESRVATVAFLALLVIVFIALFAPWISPTDPYDLATVDILDNRLPPGSEETPQGS